MQISGASSSVFGLALPTSGPRLQTIGTYDLVWSGERARDPANGKLPAVGNTVDAKNATYRNNIGATELKQVWADPDFNRTLTPTTLVSSESPRLAGPRSTRQRLRRIPA
jgi:hypothetical protein